MAQRSTRNKLKWQGDKAIMKVEQLQQHLKNIYDLAGGGSDMVNKSLPGLVEMSELMLTTLRAFRAAL